MARDPVCGMQVDEAKASVKVEHNGQTFVFCGEHCRKEFERQPGKYAVAR